MEDGENTNNIKKELIFKKWWFWLIICIIVIGIAAVCVNRGKTEKVNQSKTAAADIKSSAPGKAKTNKYKVGDTVQLTDYKITVNEVYTVAPTEMYAPKDGDEFLALDCTIENISKKQQTISSMMMFKVVNKNGEECEYSVTGLLAAKAHQLDGSLDPGKKMTGVYIVEIPKGLTGLQLEFDNILVDRRQIAIQLD